MKYSLVVMVLLSLNVYADTLSPQSHEAQKCLDRAPFLNPDILQKGKGKVTLFLGTSTAGKTTHINKLLAADPGLLNYGIDPILFRGTERMIARRHKAHYAAIKKVTSQFVVKLVKRIKRPADKLVLLKDASDKDVKIALTSLAYLNEKYKNDALVTYRPSIISSAFEEIIRLSKQGKNVVVDMVKIGLAEELWNRGFCAPYEVILVFCPFKELSNRLLTRNADARDEGEMSNYRGIAPLQEYAEIYRPVKEDDEPVLETLDKEVLIKELRRHKMSADEEKRIISALGFVTPDIKKVNITSRFKGYDRIIGVK